MAQATNIEWCDSTFNGWIGCTKVSPGCDHCYAAVSTPARTLAVTWGANAPRHRTSDANWEAPLKWQAKAEAFRAEHGRNRRVFCSSLADVFDNEVPDAWREDLFALIRTTPALDWLLLTKRPQNIVRMVRSHGAMAGNGTRYLPDNVWLGTTAEDQKRADINVPALLRTRNELGARVLFVSVEPMLGPVDLERPRPGPDLDQGGGQKICQPWLIQSGIDWVICGGESGSRARPMHPDWARSLRDQCAAAGVPFLFKQWGTWAKFDDDGLPGVRTVIEGDPAYRSKAAKCDAFMAIDGSVIQSLDDAAPGVRYRGMTRAGKHAAGRLLDGRTHDEFPQR